MLKKVREGIWRFIIKRKEIIFFLIITAITIAIRTFPIDYLSGDMDYDLRGWYNEFKEYGGLPGLKYDIGNYNVPYLTIIALMTYLPISFYVGLKIVSIIFDYVLAIGLMILVRKMLKDNPKKNLYSLLTYGIVLILPTVIFNSACWGQCDSIYASFAVLALIFLIDEKYIRAFIFLGVSIAFKLQGVFMLPIFLLVYIQKRKFSIFYFLIIPIVNLILCTPALIAGRPFMEVVSIYFEQMGQYSYYISLNIASVYNLFLTPDSNTNMTYSPGEYLVKMGTLVTIAIFGIVAFVSLYKKKEFDAKAILEITIWSIMVCCFFLPSMHERYGFLADILSVVYYVVDKKNGYLPVSLNTISLIEYSSFLYNSRPIPLAYLSIAYLIVLVLFSKYIFEKHFKIEEMVSTDV